MTKEDVWATEFTPIVDRLLGNLVAEKFNIGDDQTVHIPVQRFTAVLEQGSSYLPQEGKWRSSCCDQFTSKHSRKS